MSRSSHRDPPDGVDPEVLVRHVLAGLPVTAAAMYTLLTVGPEAREPLFRHVSEAAAEVDRDRIRVMAAVADLPQSRRAQAILVAQTASLLASIMVATARVAGQGCPGALPHACEEVARGIVALADQLAAVVPRQRDHAPATIDSVSVSDPGHVLSRLAELSDHLDLLLGVLTVQPARPHQVARVTG